MVARFSASVRQSLATIVLKIRQASGDLGVT